MVKSERPPDYGWGSEQPHTAAYLAKKVENILRCSGAKTVLDAGCGNGALASFLATRGYEVTGIDASLSGIEIARAHFPGIKFEVGTFDAGPDRPSSKVKFDAVCSTEVVEHLYAPHDLASFAFEALKPGFWSSAHPIMAT